MLSPTSAPPRALKWKKPLQFALLAALGTLLFAGLGEAWLALTAPPPLRAPHTP